MIIDDLDVVGVALAERKADPPGSVHGHGPSALAAALELVQPDALERAQVLERLGDIERQEKVGSGVEIQAAEPVRLVAFPDARRDAPGLTTG